MKKIKNKLQINKILSEHTLNDFNKWYEKICKKIGHNIRKNSYI